MIFSATETEDAGNTEETVFHLSDFPTFVHNREIFLPCTEDVLVVPTTLQVCPADAASAWLDKVAINKLASMAILEIRDIP